MRYLIVGNSIAAVNAVVGIREKDREGEITIVSEEGRQAYGRPLISYWLEDKGRLEDLDYRPESFYEKYRARVLLSECAERIDPEKRKVTCSSGLTLNYDRLLIATGGRPFVPPIEGLNEVNYRTFLRYSDVEQLDQSIKAGDRAIVLGGGLIGLKAAESLVNRGLQVTVVELAEHILSSILPAKCAAIVEAQLKEVGLDFRLGATIEEVRPEREGVTTRLSNGESLTGDHFIVAIGVIPNKDLAAAAGAQVGRGIQVDECMATSLPDVYAAGDVVEVTEPLSKSVRVAAILPNAAWQGRIAGRAMAGALPQGTYPVGMLFNSLGVLGTQIFTLGLTSPRDTASLKEISVTTAAGGHRWFFLDGDRLRGAVFLNEKGPVGVFQGILYKDIPVDEKLLGKDWIQLMDLPEQYWQDCLAV